MAETWLRTHVLPYYPASKITHIVVGHSILCFSHTHQAFHFILPALKNLHHSLTRWGLEGEIKVSPSLSSHCLAPNLAHSLINPFLHFIQDTNSTYLINPSEPISSISDPKIQTFLSSHLESLQKLGFSSIGKINLVVETPKEAKPTMRKLAFVVPPAQSFPIAKGPLPPLVGPTPSPPSPFSVPLPHMGLSPALSPHSHHPHLLPPCNPWAGPSPPLPTPGPEAGEKLWCVAKPSVPAETLQEAMDYACGEGEAECDEIQANGNCYYPDTLVAHASFAFNSYWQKTKSYGGTCSFGGTAMLINSDPSFLHCKFIVN